jgi:hypothetical protein
MHVTFSRPRFSVKAIEKQNNAHIYEDYSYEYTLLKPFTKKRGDDNAPGWDVDASNQSGTSVSSTRSFKKNVLQSSRNLIHSSGNHRTSARKTKMSKRSQSTYIRGI